MQRTHSYSYGAILNASDRIRWSVDDVLGERDGFDFSRPFLPDSLAAVQNLDFLTPEQRCTLNQIRGHAYLSIFGLVEEFILPFVLDHTRPLLAGEAPQVRALLGFATEEAKHIHLFERFRAAFERSFGVRCEVIGPAREIGRSVLAHHPLGVALTILHVEWMTQRHYVESVRNEDALEPRFTSLLRHHWMEEAQHAKLDTLIVESLATSCSAEERRKGFDDYLAIGALLDAALGQQVQFDLDAFERATGRRLTSGEYARASEVQRRSNRWTYLGSGMTHPNFLGTLGAISPEARTRLQQLSPAFC